MTTIKRYHYVYRITNVITKMYYYGTRSTSKLKETKPKEDIGIKYFSTSLDKEFIKNQKENPQNYKYKVVKTFNTRKEALELEIYLHKKFDVGVNKNFYNKSKQTATGFDNSGLDFMSIAKQQVENGSYKLRGQKSSITHSNKSKLEKETASKMFKLAFSKIDLSQRAKNGVITKIKRGNMPIGSNNGMALKINIYDNTNKLQYTTNGSFADVCNSNNLPKKALSISYKNNGKPIYCGRIQQIVKDKGYDKYIGWYALKLI